MFSWLDNIRKKIKELNVSVDTYKEETGNQTLPATAYANRAKKLIDKSMFLEARDVLSEALLITQKDALIYKYFGLCEESLGNVSAAIEMYKKSSRINPQDKNIWHKLGMSYIAVKDYESAEKSFEQADKITPVNTDILTGWGMALMKQKKYSQSLEKFTNAIKVNRYNFSALLLAAIVEIRLEKYDEAQNKLTFLMKTNPTEGCAYEYSKLCFYKENYDEAINYALKSIELNPGMLPAYLMLGKIYSIKFDYANSVRYFKTAEEKNLIDELLYLEWGFALVRLFRFDEALTMFNKVDALNDNVDFQGALSVCFAETENFSKSLEIITSVEEKEPENTFIIEAKGLCEQADGNLENAVCCFKKALEKTPEDIYNYFRLAKCYEKLNKFDMVKDSYDKLIKFCPGFTNAYMEYAKFLISVNDYKDAQRKLRKAENIDKNNQEILNLLFYTSYILVKDNVCEYNIKEAISLANRIQNLDYPEFKVELEALLRDIKEN